MTFLALKKLTGANIVGIASRHNLREIQAENGADKHIDPTRIRLNRLVSGPAASGDVAALAMRLMADAGVDAVRLRKDAVRALELVISPPERFKGELAAFFGDALQWAEKHFSAPVLSAVVHHDEAMPHMHVLILPLAGGKMNGSDMAGNKRTLQAMHASFYDAVGSLHGLPRQAITERRSASQRREVAWKILEAIRANPIVIDDDVSVVAALIDCLTNKPERLADALGIRMPEAGKKSFVEIMTMPCKTETL
jgi:hypothetical protein